MRIKAGMDKIPGGIMVIPMFIAAVINTFSPGLLRIGGFTEELFVNGVIPFMAFVLLSTGAQINLRNAKTAVAKGLTILVIEFIVAAGFGLSGIFILQDPMAYFSVLLPLLFSLR